MIICSVRGCFNNSKKRQELLQEECPKHGPQLRAECSCGAGYDLHSPPEEPKALRLWIKALNLRDCRKVTPHVCSVHFVDKKPTKEHPYPEKGLQSDDMEHSQTMWSDSPFFEHNYCLISWLNTADEETQYTEPVHHTLLRTEALSLLYTGLSLVVFHSVAKLLVPLYSGSFQLDPTDQLLLTLMKLRLNLLRDDLAERFTVSQSVVDQVLSYWIDLLEENMRGCIPWLPRETIRATMPQCFKEVYPSTTCIIDYSQSLLQKDTDLDLESFSHCSSAENAIKYLVAIAPCGLIMFISSAYDSRFCDKFITTNSEFVMYLRPGDEVLATEDLTIHDLLRERKVKLITIPAVTRKELQLSEEDAAHRRRVADVRVHMDQIIRRLKHFRILSQDVPADLAHRIDKILRICAALCNLMGDVIEEDTENWSW